MLKVHPVFVFSSEYETSVGADMVRIVVWLPRKGGQTFSQCVIWLLWERDSSFWTTDCKGLPGLVSCELFWTDNVSPLHLSCSSRHEKNIFLSRIRNFGSETAMLCIYEDLFERQLKQLGCKSCAFL